MKHEGLQAAAERPVDPQAKAASLYGASERPTRFRTEPVSCLRATERPDGSSLIRERAFGRVQINQAASAYCLLGAH